MCESNKDMLVEELETIAQQYNSKVEYENEILPDINEKRKHNINMTLLEMRLSFSKETSNADEALKKKKPCLPSIACVKAPPEPTNPGRDKRRLVFTAFFGLLILALLIPGLTFLFFRFGKTLAALAIPLVVAWIFLFSRLDDFVDYLDRWKQWQAENTEALSGASAEEERAAFLQQCSVYENALSEGVQQVAARAKELVVQANTEIEAANQKAAEDTERSKAEYDKLCEQLSSVSMIHPDLVPQAHRMARLIRTGRADTVKEAANLATEEETQERQEQARQEEARQFLEILRRETEKHNRAMEEATEEQNRIARQQLAAQAEANRIAEQERRDADRARQAAQDAAYRESRKAQRKYLDARNRFNSASAKYRAITASGGSTQDALYYKKQMELAQVDMINSGWSE